MLEAAAYSTVAMTLSLVVARPRIGTQVRVSPALAAALGVAVLAALGVVGAGTALSAAAELWQPFVAIAAIMVMTEGAQRLGLLSWWAAHLEAHARSPAQLFALVFVLGVVTASALTNDAAILLLTPGVVALVRRRFPDRPDLVLPFAFAVFMAAGVAPFVVSNPMNLVVAEASGIGFNAYAVRMAPVAVGCWAVSFGVLWLVFRRRLVGTLGTGDKPPAATGAQRWMMVLLAAVLVSYSVVSYLGGAVWAVASCGAVAAALVAHRARRIDPRALVKDGVSWHTLGFLFAVLVLSKGLANVGFVDRLAHLYESASLAEIGVVSAFGSATLNNHPMAYLNMMALEASPHGTSGVLAALIGGDLGPRLLPMGSLAGLLWLEMLRRQGVHVGIGRFAAIGAMVTVPALAVCLALLLLLG